MDSGHSRANLVDVYLPPGALRSRPSFAETIKRRAQYLQKQAHVFYFVFRHPRTRWYGRLIAICAAAYVFSPIQLIPNFIPVIGCIDDVLVILLAARILRKITPPDVLAECRELADAAETRRNEEIRRWVVGPVIMATIWLFGVLVASALVATYIYF
jgi:uncharacterized membrane protein YkvA (DUF1232 family)